MDPIASDENSASLCTNTSNIECVDGTHEIIELDDVEVELLAVRDAEFDLPVDPINETNAEVTSSIPKLLNILLEVVHENQTNDTSYEIKDELNISVSKGVDAVSLCDDVGYDYFDLNMSGIPEILASETRFNDRNDSLNTLNGNYTNETSTSQSTELNIFHNDISNNNSIYDTEHQSKLQDLIVRRDVQNLLMDLISHISEFEEENHVDFDQESELDESLSFHATLADIMTNDELQISNSNTSLDGIRLRGYKSLIVSYDGIRPIHTPVNNMACNIDQLQSSNIHDETLDDIALQNVIKDTLYALVSAIACSYSLNHTS